jgi:hypothetical protein
MNLEALNENKYMIGVQRIEQLIVFSALWGSIRNLDMLNA